MRWAYTLTPSLPLLGGYLFLRLPPEFQLPRVVTELLHVCCGLPNPWEIHPIAVCGLLWYPVVTSDIFTSPNILSFGTILPLSRRGREGKGEEPPRVGLNTWCLKSWKNSLVVNHTCDITWPNQGTFLLLSLSHWTKLLSNLFSLLALLFVTICLCNINTAFN